MDEEPPVPVRPLPRPLPRLEDDSGMFMSKSVRAAERLPLPSPDDPRAEG